MARNAEARKPVPESEKPYAVTPDTAGGKTVSGEIGAESKKPKLTIIEGGKGKGEVVETEAEREFFKNGERMEKESAAAQQLEANRQELKNEKASIFNRMRRSMDSLKGLFNSLAEAKVVAPETAKKLTEQADEIEDLTEFATEISEEQGQVEGAMVAIGSDKDFDALISARVQEMQAENFTQKQRERAEEMLNVLRQTVAERRLEREKAKTEAEAKAQFEKQTEEILEGTELEIPGQKDVIKKWLEGHSQDLMDAAIDAAEGRERLKEIPRIEDDSEMNAWLMPDYDVPSDASDEEKEQAAAKFEARQARRQDAIAKGELFATPQAKAEAEARKKTPEERLKNNEADLKKAETKRNQLIQDVETLFEAKFKIKNFDMEEVASDQSARDKLIKQLSKELRGFGKRAERASLREWMKDWVENEKEIRALQGAIQLGSENISNPEGAEIRALRRGLEATIRSATPERKERIAGMVKAA
ncbi:hypothetical protein A3B21_04795 [Candidatus Uhrbacteria bacterium RIFCSPLOWO2_01_FULL_47_24]|uniref:Uncharacterized protein n=1 Tax=Candidatus Uhrbacteria bacterium RIFCSPLOWO2_01_FULL_47_24 TaxID=1802401 RepID=A0A1F7UWI2_9BACT|nr:MAG: hypothetical protein A2753_00415 [Candidatus Uhrbacteria bacterium RIFCSPHIGHO2_01_FULL_47_11]OGL69271.1 MAG: hypothetical protein A3D58_03180 [Candidatus Uhrbacteria bacterium RIFCSPHIGHO2_02_FULL_46_47]OGL76911.1 MAG: hypothetical protein A3F52_00505 [Candidatus Uhrbacteria bacterium RIFCSPHIGHO2_12_FULL_47_11]OGL82007.1 MAG: hypothetical protein A3B21_04795 [Candidatus Uhrbacteria bacterium RIFCSPLOWO2_01_FULL_47_24]OGL85401.1 MAG: hypothetical protein A3J03_04960 [Candidatus Uhrbact